MAPRRTHQKSRLGCLSCKRRRVKCDEGGPPCGPCTSRQIDCEYPRSNRPSISLTPSGQTQSSNSALTLTSGSPEPQTELPKRLLELELMHHWSTSTYKCLCGALESEYPTWQIILPQEAFETPFLLDGMLALAALEIAAIGDKSDRERYLQVALEYHDKGLEGFRSKLADIPPGKHQAVFAFSVITMILSLAFPQVTKSRDEPQSIVENMVTHFELAHGAGILTIQNWEVLMKAPIYRNYRPYDQSNPRPLEPSVVSAIARLNALNEERHNPQLHQSWTSTLQATTDHAACRKAIIYLEQIFARCDDPWDQGYALGWLNMSGRDYVRAVQNENPVALLVLMHWGVLALRCSANIWWAIPIGKCVVEEMSNALCGDQDPVLRESVSWARNQVGL